MTGATGHHAVRSGVAGDDPWLRAESGWRRFAAGDRSAGPSAVAALAVLGLVEPAREIMEAMATTASDRRELDALAQHLEGIPASEAPQSEVMERLERAAQRLERLGADGEADRLRAGAPRLRAARCRSGYWHVSIVQSVGLRTWPLGIRRPVVDPALPRQFAPLRGHAVLLIGVTAEPLIEAVMAATMSAPGSSAAPAPGTGIVPPIYVAESDEDRLAAWLATPGRSALLASERVLLCPGRDGAARYRDLLERREGLPPHSAVVEIHKDAPLRAAMDETAAAMRRAREATRARARETIVRRDAARSDAERAARLTPGATIVGFVSRFTTMVRHSMRDIGDALEAMGYRFILCEEHSAIEPHTAHAIARLVADEDPALIVMINHLRREHADLFGEVPVLTWVQDPVEEILSVASGTSIAQRDFVVGYFSRRLVEEFGYPPDRVLGLGWYPVSAVRFHDAPLPAGSAQDPPPVDLVYVGHLHETPEEFIRSHRQGQAAPAARLLDAMAAAVDRVIGQGRHLGPAGAAVLVEAAAEETGATLAHDGAERLGGSFVHRLFDLRFRLQSLRWAASWARDTGRRMSVYGRGWERVPDLAGLAAGPVEHGEPLRRVYRAATLALQTIPTGFMHQRSFESILSGAIPIIRATPVDFGPDGIDAFTRHYGEGSAAPFGAGRHGFAGLASHAFDSEAAFRACAERLLADRTSADARRRAWAQHIRSLAGYDARLPGILEFVRHGLTDRST